MRRISRLLALGVCTVAAAAAAAAADARSAAAVDATLASAESQLQRLRSHPNELGRAKELVLVAARKLPNEPRVALLEAWLASLEHRFEPALLRLREPGAALASNPAAMALEIDLLTELGRYDEAVQRTDELLDLGAGMPAWTRMAHLRFLHGDLAGAIAAAQQALRMVRPDSEAHTWVTQQLAELLLHANQIDECLRLTEYLTPRAPDAALLLRARALVAAARLDEAAQAADELSRRVPSAEHHYLAWQIAARRGASADLRRHARMLDALALLDRDGLSRRTLASYFAHRPAQREQALTLAQAEFALRPDIYSHATLAEVHAARGELDIAREHAKAALRLGTPDSELLPRLRALLGISQ
jgi:predicted Zn-dependent protease